MRHLCYCLTPWPWSDVEAFFFKSWNTRGNIDAHLHSSVSSYFHISLCPPFVPPPPRPLAVFCSSPESRWVIAQGLRARERWKGKERKCCVRAHLQCMRNSRSEGNLKGVWTICVFVYCGNSCAYVVDVRIEAVCERMRHSGIIDLQKVQCVCWIRGAGIGLWACKILPQL